MERTVIDVVLITVVCIAAVTDLARGKVYNVITLPAIALGLALNGVFWGAEGLRDSVMAGALAFGFLILPVVMRGMGAGDLKLLVAIGGLGGVQLLLVAFAVAALFAGVVAAVILACRRFAVVGAAIPAYRRLAFLSFPVYIGIELGKVRALPYAVGMALGCLVALYAR